MLEVGNAESLERLTEELLGKDWFMTFPDFDSYLTEKARVLNDVADQHSWQRKALVNIAKAGFFSSDRTIEQYNRDIWHLSVDSSRNCE